MLFNSTHGDAKERDRGWRKDGPATWVRQLRMLMASAEGLAAALRGGQYLREAL
jgi:hypothetical protein